MKKIGRYGKKTRKLPKIFLHFCYVICCRGRDRVRTVDVDDFMSPRAGVAGGLSLEVWVREYSDSPYSASDPGKRIKSNLPIR
jgi:hypothetical protein